MSEKLPVFGSKRKMRDYEEEHPPKVCKQCLRTLSRLEMPDGTLQYWCLNCQGYKIGGK